MNMKHGHGKQLRNKQNFSGMKMKKTLFMMKRMKEKNFMKQKKPKTYKLKSSKN